MKPWIGACRPLSPDAFDAAAQELGCDEAAIQAVWKVEASGRYYDTKGQVLHRFEPHKLPWSSATWRDSLELTDEDRAALFREAWATDPEATMRATSWGAPQIMGFNAEDAGYTSARKMVEAMANSENAHLDAFVGLVRAWGLDSALRAHDWLAFSRAYNGTGQPEVYARRMERAYRRLTGRKSPQVLRVGDRGSAVRRLQEALGIETDGAFGPETERVVAEFQKANGLVVDGVVGARTWAALESRGRTRAPAQEDSIDRVIERAEKATGVASGASFAASPILDRLTDNMLTIVLIFAGVAGLVALGFWLWRRHRKER